MSSADPEKVVDSEQSSTQAVFTDNGIDKQQDVTEDKEHRGRGRQNEPNDEHMQEERPAKWSMGILNDTETNEVPGSVLLLTGHRNGPLGLKNAPARTSASSIPAGLPGHTRAQSIQSRQRKPAEDKKMTKDGAIILEPQPDDSYNDPLNWPSWRRDSALLSLGIYCMLGGGMTPILAAGFNNVATTYHVTTPKVALTTGLYMMGLGVGSVFASPTAILYGKRPVYLVGAIIFILTAVWCALSPSYISLLIARIVQGMSVSPVECLPSATIAEIFFLHERAYRIGIYTLLLLGGKNLIPLVSAAIIQSLGWRWVFWIVAIVAGFCLILLFFFVPETFWDRTPRPADHQLQSRVSEFFHHLGQIASKPNSKNASRSNSRMGVAIADRDTAANIDVSKDGTASGSAPFPRPSVSHGRHVGFAPDGSTEPTGSTPSAEHSPVRSQSPKRPPGPQALSGMVPLDESIQGRISGEASLFNTRRKFNDTVSPLDEASTEVASPVAMPDLHTFNSPFYVKAEEMNSDYLERGSQPAAASQENRNSAAEKQVLHKRSKAQPYTSHLQERSRLTFAQHLRPWNGRLNNDRWLRVAIRPFILFAYPAVLWSAVVYSCSIGWLIVLSESISTIYRSKDTYNFSALSAGLIYLSPFIGGVLGTAVAGKVSDIIVRAMSKRNGGLYEPEFRLVMAVPITITTVIGLMGFGWSAQERDAWIVPTVFFGIISFGCSLGSTTSITFCVDSYRQYAGEALVTLNFSKNIFHGLVFSLFFTEWLAADGSKMVFIWLGVIQLIFMSLSIPMYIFGKRARMWTVRKNFMEKF